MFYSASRNGFFDDSDREKFEANNNWPQDAAKIPDELYDVVCRNRPVGKVVIPDMNGFPVLIDAVRITREQLLSEYEAALDAHFNSVAQQHGWSSFVTFTIRAGFPNPWRDQATKFGIWIDDCNQQAYAQLASILPGETEMPSKEAIILSLPEFVLP
jgi:hypothetical protein